MTNSNQNKKPLKKSKTSKKWLKRHFDDPYVKKSWEQYLNGELDRSVFLPNVPWISNDNLYIGQAGNNFNSHVGLVEYFNDALTIDKVKSLYNKNKGKSIFRKKLITYAKYYKEKMDSTDI